MVQAEPWDRASSITLASHEAWIASGPPAISPLLCRNDQKVAYLRSSWQVGGAQYRWEMWLCSMWLYRRWRLSEFNKQHRTSQQMRDVFPAVHFQMMLKNTTHPPHQSHTIPLKPSTWKPSLTETRQKGCWKWEIPSDYYRGFSTEN